LSLQANFVILGLLCLEMLSFITRFNISDNKPIPLKDYKRLQGPVNDITILSEVLSLKYNFEVSILSDLEPFDDSQELEDLEFGSVEKQTIFQNGEIKEATYKNILDAFQDLQEKAFPQDIVIIYYSGHEHPASDGTGNWLPVDTQGDTEGDSLNLLSMNEIYDLIEAIPSFNKSLIMESGVSLGWNEFIEKVNKNNLCNLIFAASPKQFSYEIPIGDNKKRYGYFTHCLVQELKQASEITFLQDILDQIKNTVQSKFPSQIPFFCGDLERPFCFSIFDIFILNFIQCRCYTALSERFLNFLKNEINIQTMATFPDCYYSLGLAYLEKGNNAQALIALNTAIEQAKQKKEEQLFYLGIAQFNNQLYSDTYQTFQQCFKIKNSNTYNEIITLLKKLTESKRYALLVGIDSYVNTDKISALNDAVSDTLSLKNILVNECGFESQNITVLTNKDATYYNILTNFKKLVELSQSNTTLFYFAGRGSYNIKDNPAILAHDSRYGRIQDILLSDLAQIANNNDNNLVSIIDSCWTMGGNQAEKNRFVTIPGGIRTLKAFYVADHSLDKEEDVINIFQVQKLQKVRLIISIETVDQATQNALTALQNAIVQDAKDWIKLSNDEDNSEEIDYYIEINEKGEYEIQDRWRVPFKHITPLLTITDLTAPQKIVERLIHIIKYQTALNVGNLEPNSPLENDLLVEWLNEDGSPLHYLGLAE